jgi:hypothetical protein
MTDFTAYFRDTDGDSVSFEWAMDEPNIIAVTAESVDNQHVPVFLTINDAMALRSFLEMAISAHMREASRIAAEKVKKDEQ